MRIVVIGGSGYVGSLILSGLIAAGHEVCVLDPAAPAGDVSWVQGSALDPVALDAALDGADALIHSAMGRPQPDRAPEAVTPFSILVTSVYTALAAAARAGMMRIVLISSLSVFADEPVPLTDRMLDETSPPDATDVYGMAKRLAEHVGQAAAEAHGMTVTALRIAWPTTDSAWPAWALPAFPSPAIIRHGDGTPVPALAASDLTAAVLAALERDGGGFEAVHILGDNDSGRCWNTAKARALLGWQSKRR